jgi:hypothetical protein
VKTEDRKGCIEVARANGWGGMADEAATELKALDGSAMSIERHGWNAALEAAAALVDAEAARVESEYQRQRAMPGGDDNFNLWNWYSGSKSSAEHNAKRVRSLKRGQL